MTITKIYPLPSRGSGGAPSAGDASASVSLLSEKAVARRNVMGDSSNRFLRFSASVSSRKSNTSTCSPTGVIDDKENIKNSNGSSLDHEKKRLFKSRKYRYYDLPDEDDFFTTNNTKNALDMDDDGAFSIITMSDWTFGTGLPDSSICVDSQNGQHPTPGLNVDESLSILDADMDDDNTMTSSAIYSYDIDRPLGKSRQREERNLARTMNDDAQRAQLVLDDASAIYSYDAGYSASENKKRGTPNIPFVDASSTIGSLSYSVISPYHNSGDCIRGEKQSRQARLGGFQGAVHPTQFYASRGTTTTSLTTTSSTSSSSSSSHVIHKDIDIPRMLMDDDGTCYNRVKSTTRITRIVRRHLISAFGCFRQVSMWKRCPATDSQISWKGTGTSSFDTNHLTPSQNEQLVVYGYEF